MRGSKSADGDERVARNGYWYVKTEDGWKLKHRWLVEQHLGRELTSEERVVFKDNDRTNFDINNLEIQVKASISKKARKARLEARKEEIEAELAKLNKEVG